MQRTAEELGDRPFVLMHRGHHAGEAALHDGVERLLIELLPYAPADQLREHLCSADVHLISMDSRWAEISDKDIATWLDALEPVQFERVHKVAELAIERLRRVQQMLAEHEQRLGVKGEKQ